MRAVYEQLNRGLTRYHRGAFFDAHEAWEEAWRPATDPERALLQGLIQLAASLVKRDRGEARGVQLNFAKALANVQRAQLERSSLLGFDLVELQASLGLLEDLVRDRPLEIGPPPLPQRVWSDGLLYLHGFASGPGSYKARRFAEAMARLGFDLAIPDLNAGDFSHLTLSRSIELAQRKLCDRSLVIGSSFGGYTAALLSARDPRVKGLVLMAPAFDLGERLTRRHGPEEMARWRAEGSLLVEHHATGDRQPIAIDLIDDATRYPRVVPLAVPAYVLHGRRDETVPFTLSIEARDQAQASFELDLVDDTHGLEATVDRAIAATQRMIAALGLSPPAAIDPAGATS